MLFEHLSDKQMDVLKATSKTVIGEIPSFFLEGLKVGEDITFYCVVIRVESIH